MGNVAPLEVRALNSDCYSGISLPAGADPISRYVRATYLGGAGAAPLNGLTNHGTNGHSNNGHSKEIQVVTEKEDIGKVVNRQSIREGLQEHFDKELKGRYHFFGKTGIILSYDGSIVCGFDVNFKAPKVHYEKIPLEDRNKFSSILGIYVDIVPYDNAPPKSSAGIGLIKKARNLQHQAVVLSQEFTKEVPRDYGWFIEHIFLAPFFLASDTLFVAITGIPKNSNEFNGQIETQPK